MNETAPRPHMVTLRKGSADDLDAVVEIMNHAFDPRYGEAWTRSQCAGILPMSGVSLTLADDAAGPVGFALHRIVAGEAELLLLAVARQAQRQGIGGKLLEGFVKDSAAAGARQVHLEVRENNVALQMYRAAGFTLVGRRPDYYRGNGGGKFDALTFARSLSVPTRDGI
ncbi:MAG TPA: GNAT family N-acetyltransferase [Sphingomicrobium sp.]|jgi:ribosomal-protein-alanine N-acetyltransferase